MILNNDKDIFINENTQEKIKIEINNNEIKSPVVVKKSRES